MMVIDKLSKVAQIFIKEIIRLHGIPKKIISNWEAKFTSRFWKELFASLGTKLAFSTTYHPQSDEQTERTNRILEDMLSMYVMHQPKKWEEYLSLVEFAYNNGYQESIKMSPFEALYGRSCNSPISDPVNMVCIGLICLRKWSNKFRLSNIIWRWHKIGRKSMQIGIGCIKSYKLGNTFTWESNPRRVPWRPGHVPSWHHDIVGIWDPWKDWTSDLLPGFTSIS